MAQPALPPATLGRKAPSAKRRCVCPHLPSAPVAGGGGAAWSGAVAWLCFSAGHHSRSAPPASTLQAGAGRAVRAWDAPASLSGWQATAEEEEKNQKRKKKERKKKNKSQTTNTTNTARSFHIWSFSSWPWHNLQASCWSRCVCASFIRQSASLWKQHQDLSTGKDPPLATDQNRHRAGFFLHAWRDLVNKIASEDANDKFKKNVICPKY